MMMPVMVVMMMMMVDQEDDDGDAVLDHDDAEDEVEDENWRVMIR